MADSQGAPPVTADQNVCELTAELAQEHVSWDADHKDRYANVRGIMPKGGVFGGIYETPTERHQRSTTPTVAES